ncbi:MAG: hypothetical protein PHQ54_01125 [Candidatus Omnitrophica bacterium]|nr:hypothetical protein [Candidatus Omnitrophota bacterium]
MLKKILIAVLAALIVSGLSLGYFLLYQEKQKESALRKEAELSLAMLSNKNQQISSELEKIKNEYEAVRSEFEGKSAENKELAAEIEKITAVLKDAQAEMTMLYQERDVMLTRLKNQEQELKNYKSSLETATVKPDNILKEEVKLEDIKVKETAQGADNQMPVKIARISAEVMAFNREYGFVVLNKGSKDGISGGSTYSYGVQGQNLGRLKPDRVYESMSVLDILEGKENISEGMRIDIVQDN